MKQASIYFFGLLVLCNCNQQNDRDNISKANDLTKQIGNKEYENFKLYYSYAGLGSGMGSMQPTFSVSKTGYIYTFEQNSFYTKPDKQPEIRWKGMLRNSSIDSIINIAKDIKDTLIYKTTAGILSGGIHNLSIEFENRKVTFQLHNAYDSTAQEILDILNSNIPDAVEKLWLFKFPDKK